MFSGPASRCGQSPDSRARPGGSDRKAGRTGARTSGMRKEARATAKALARLAGRPPYKRWRVQLLVSCDRKWGTQLASVLEVLCRGTDYNLIDFHVGGLLDG